MVRCSARFCLGRQRQEQPGASAATVAIEKERFLFMVFLRLAFSEWRSL